MNESAGIPDDEFGELFDSYHTAVWRYLARLGGRETADDLAGDVFARAWTVRERYESNRGSPRAWLFGIAANVLRQHFRTERRARAAFERAGRATVVPISAIEQVDERDELDQLRYRTMNAIAACDADDRALIAMAVWEAMPYAEIAAALDIPVGTVRSRLSRLRGRLRDAVDPDHTQVSVKGEQS